MIPERMPCPWNDTSTEAAESDCAASAPVSHAGAPDAAVPRA